SAKEQARATRTIFAQQRLRPADVLPEWEKANTALGGPADVERFVRLAAAEFNAPLHGERDVWRLPLDHLPCSLRERAAGIGIDGPVRLVFNRPGPTGTLHATRAHPLVRLFAEYFAECALADQGDIAARCGALFSGAVSTRTVLAILRLRAQIEV